MTVVTYSLRVAVHPDRTGGPKNRANEIFVLHTSEGSEGDNSAEALASMMTRPGDRPSSSRPGGFFGSSYQYVTDTGMVAIPCTPETTVSYSAPPANTYGVHICLPGKADQVREQWLDGISRQYIRCAAGIMVDRSGPLGIPLVRLSLADLKAHRRGYCDHDDIADAFGQTDHYDLGPNFPWDVLAADIHALARPDPPEDPVPVHYFKLHPDGKTLWATSDGLTAVRLEAHQANGRGVDMNNVPVLPATEHDDYVFLQGLTSESVK